MHLEEKHSL